MKGDYIVKEIQIQNFRSLKDTGLQELSPITLLIGENSSGKSTFLRSFPLIKQSISKRTAGPILWAGDVDDYVDFGSFDETVTNDKSNEIMFRFCFALKDMGFLYRYFSLDDYMGVEESRSRNNQIDYQIFIKSTNGKDYVARFDVNIDSVCYKFNLENGNIQVDDFVFEQRVQPLSEELGYKSPRIRIITGAEDSQAFGFRLPNIDDLSGELFDKLIKEKEQHRSSLISEVIVALGDNLTQNKIIYLSTEENMNSRQLTNQFIKLYNKTVKLIKDDIRLRSIVKLCYFYRMFSDIDQYIFNYFKQVHYIAPLRATAERYYRLRNLAIDEVDYQGKNLAIFINSLNDRQLSQFHAWTNDHFGFSVSTGKDKGHLSLLIKLKGSDKAINLSDTGFGYSQVLPIITQLWELSTRKKEKMGYLEVDRVIPLVVAIEQPELHLHPAVQAKLGKAFIASIHLARENGYQLQLLLETHSQTLVNYLGRAIYRGELDNQDVSVILFEKDPYNNITTVTNSYYDSEGYLENWPYGFFDPED